MRKLLKSLKVAAAAVAMTTIAIASAHAFDASGYMTRDANGTSYFAVTNLETGRTYQFYGTGASCKPGGLPYNSVGAMMGRGQFHAKFARCPINPSLDVLYINNYRFYTTVSNAAAFDDFDGNF